MELRKTSESINRSYDEEGNAQDRVDTINYSVLDAEGNAIGSAFVNHSHLHIEANVYGQATIEERDAMLRTLCGCEAPNP